MTYKINNDFFNDINTEIQAYLLGWFYSRGSGHIQVNTTDSDILFLIRDSLDYSGPIHSYGNVSELNITQTTFSTHLNAAGCVPNKKHNTSFPYNMYGLSHFVRGIFDSYGSIIINKSKYLNIHITYNETFIDGFRHFLLDSMNISTKHYYKYSHTNTLQMMITNTKDALLFCQWLYDGATYYLARKYSKYRDFIEKGV